MNASGGGIQTPIPISKSSTRSSITSTSSARQKKFHRHFSQVIANFYFFFYIDYNYLISLRESNTTNN